MTADNLEPVRPDEDQPVRLEPGLPPEIASPLAPFAGAQPERTKWFEDALAIQPERTLVPVKGANIELLTWGRVGDPGLILVHGNSAHADWWSFIAPFFAETYRVAAISLSGMGGSDWRDAYSFDMFGEEIHDCAIAAGLYEGPVLPIFIGHSFRRRPGVPHRCASPRMDARGPCWSTPASAVRPTQEEMDRVDAEDRAAGRAPAQLGADRRAWAARTGSIPP